MRKAVVALSVSIAAFIGILTHEGYRESAYIPVQGDVPTIGFGTTKNVKIGDKITPEKALVRALQDISMFESGIKQCVKVPLHQYEYDAYVSLSYNIGTNAFCKSTLVKLLNQEKYTEACNQIKRWVYSGGVKYQGLVNRREREHKQCLGILT